MATWRFCVMLIALSPVCALANSQGPDLIVCHGKIVTVDPQFTTVQAMAVTDGKVALLFKEHQVGSLEPGNVADFIVVDNDILTCPPEQIENTKVLKTYLAGKLVFRG